MAVVMVATIEKWIGLSTDVKPAAPTYAGSEFYEEDTGRTYLWNTVAWVIKPVHILNVQGGAYTIQDLMEEHLAQLDFARVQTIASPVTLTNAYQYIYSRAGGAHPFFFSGGFFSQDSGAWAGGESVTIAVQLTVDGTNWETVWSLNLLAAASPLTVAVPSGYSEDPTLNIPVGFWVGSNCGVRVGIIQGVVGAGYGVWSHNFVDGVRGG